MTHVSDQQMVECFQSAYRKKHSTETAPLYATSAIKTAMDNKQRTVVLVDFSAAFDTINNDILIRRLHTRTRTRTHTHTHIYIYTYIYIYIYIYSYLINIVNVGKYV